MPIESAILWLGVSLQVVGFLAGIGCLIGRCRRWHRVWRCMLVTTLLALGVTVLIAPAYACPCSAGMGLNSMLLCLIAITPPCREWTSDPYALMYAGE